MLSGWRPPHQRLTSVAHASVRLAGGGAIGFLAGLIGRGGGSLVVPLLFMSGMEAKMAAATSAFVVSCAGVSSCFTCRIAESEPET